MTTSFSDLELFRALKEQNPSALTKLYNSYGDIMYGLACQILGNHQEAEDLIQEVLLSLWRNCSYNPQRGSFKSFLMLVVRSRAIDRLRSRKTAQKVNTLAKLIASLYRPKSGNIHIGMYNLQDLPLDCLRQQIVLIPQDAHFWSRSILENFRLANPQGSFEQIVKACQVAGADEFINQLPDKYQTILGEFGANLSEGQRQRLAIARGILNNPPILILPEFDIKLLVRVGSREQGVGSSVYN